MPWRPRSVETRDGYPRKVNPRTLDHVALWVADRHLMAEVAIQRLGVRVIEETDRFTLLGADARRGKLTLFDAEGPRERGPLARIGLRVSSLDGRDATVDLGEGLEIVLVEAETDSELDLDHIALVSADPAAASEQWQALGFAPAADGRLEVGGAFLELVAGDPGDPRTAASEPHRRPRRLGRGASGRRGGSRHRDRRPRRRAEHDCALRLGARPGEARVRRAQALVLAHLKDLTVAGAGMAGLVAGARARELGASPVVLDKGTRPGGSMLLSSGVVWRHRSTGDFRRECPGGDPALQRRIVDELDDALDWLETLGVEPLAGETGNPRTVGRRYDPRSLTDVLVRAAGDVRLESPFAEAQVLATGGFGARLARDRGLLLRANRWSVGEGLDYGLGLGGSASQGMDEYYGRAMPGQVAEDEFVSASQLYARHALVLGDTGTELGEAAWHESDIVQRFPGGAAWYVVDAAALDQGPRTARSPMRSRSRVPPAATFGRQRSFRSRSRRRRSS